MLSSNFIEKRQYTTIRNWYTQNEHFYVLLVKVQYFAYYAISSVKGLIFAAIYVDFNVFHCYQMYDICDDYYV